MKITPMAIESRGDVALFVYLGDCYEACKDAELIIYVLLGGFCYHIPEKLNAEHGHCVSC